jgi:hypothetical protein
MAGPACRTPAAAALCNLAVAKGRTIHSPPSLCVSFPLAMFPPAYFKIVSDLIFRLLDEMLHDWKLYPFSLLFLCNKRMLLYPNFDTEKISGRCSEREICSFGKRFRQLAALSFYSCMVTIIIFVCRKVYMDASVDKRKRSPSQPNVVGDCQAARTMR